MNELIFEFAKNDLINSEYTEFGWQECHYYQFDPDELKKFAELIVRECANVAFKYAPSDESASELSSKIEEHFGLQ